MVSRGHGGRSTRHAPCSGSPVLNAYNADGATLTYVAAAHGHTRGVRISVMPHDDAEALLVEAWHLNMSPMAGLPTLHRSEERAGTYYAH